MDLIFSRSVYPTWMSCCIYSRRFSSKTLTQMRVEGASPFLWCCHFKKCDFQDLPERREEKARSTTPALESLDQKWHKPFSGTSLSCDPINLQEACKCSPRCLEEAENHRWVNNTLWTIIQWKSVIERCERTHRKEAIYESGRPWINISGTPPE